MSSIPSWPGPKSTLVITSRRSCRSSECVKDRAQNTSYSRFVEALCVCALCAVLVAGLWPFHAPRNEAYWLQNKNGLHFGRHGSILSASKFQATGSDEDPSGSLEVWLEPSLLNEKKTVLAFDSSEHPGAPFSVVQQEDALLVQRYNVDNRRYFQNSSF